MKIRVGHSTETAVVRVQNNILEAIDGVKCVFLLLLDLSAAFDTVSHDILLDRVSTDSGISGSALSWILSYLTNRTQSVLVSKKYSDPAHLCYGVRKVLYSARLYSRIIVPQLHH